MMMDYFLCLLFLLALIIVTPHLSVQVRINHLLSPNQTGVVTISSNQLIMSALLRHFTF